MFGYLQRVHKRFFPTETDGQLLLDVANRAITRGKRLDGNELHEHTFSGNLGSGESVRVTTRAFPGSVYRRESGKIIYEGETGLDFASLEVVHSRDGVQNAYMVISGNGYDFEDRGVIPVGVPSTDQTRGQFLDLLRRVREIMPESSEFGLEERLPPASLLPAWMRDDCELDAA